MPPKQKPNGFFMFMKEQQKKLHQDTGKQYSMRELPAICRGNWNSMSAEQRAVYDQQAKQLKRELQINPPPDNDCRRRDSKRNIIADRKDPVKEMEKRRLMESQKMRADLQGQNLKKIKFYIIDFQVMYKDHSETHRLPVEIGLVCLTMKDGIIKEMHRFIAPGNPPTGFRSVAMQHSEDTHQIPLNFEHADSNFKGLWQQMKDFVESEDGDFPPLFAMSVDRVDVEVCLDFIHQCAGIHEPNVLHRVYCLEDLCASLLTLTLPDSPEPSKSQVRDSLLQNRWDYRSDIRCHYHEEIDCAFCSISIVKRYCFSLFDTLAKVMDFQLTATHMPDEKDLGNIVYHPPPNNPPHASRHDEFSTLGRSLYQSSYRDIKEPMFVEKKIPIVSRVTISFDENEENESDSDSDESVLFTEEVKSTVDQYQLPELRLPKSLSVAALGSVKTMQTKHSDTGVNINVPVGRGGTVSRPLVGRGRALAAMANNLNSIKATVPRPGASASQRQPWQAMLGRGRGLGRGIAALNINED